MIINYSANSSNEVKRNFDTENPQTNGGDFCNGVEGVASLMEDLRNAVEATVDAEIENEDNRIAFSNALLHTLSIETQNFYKNLLKFKVMLIESL